MASIQKIQNLNGKPMIPARKAAARLHCAPDYIGKLCREGKLTGRLIDQAWFVELESIAAFESARAARAAARSESLSHLRKQELSSIGFVAKKPAALLAVSGAWLSFVKAAAASAAIGVVVIGSVAFTHALPFVRHAPLSAAVAQVDSPFFGAQLPTTSSGSIGGAFSSWLASLFAPQQTQVAQQPQPTQTPVTVVPTPVASTTPPVAVAPRPTVINNYPVIERTVERVVASQGVSEDVLAQRLSELSNELTSKIYQISSQISGSATVAYAPSQRIDKLSGVTITNSTITGYVAEGSTIAPTSGGTGITSYTTGDILYASGANTLSALPIGTTGQVLKVQGGVPVWGTNVGGSGGASAFATTSDNLAIVETDPTQVFVLGAAGTSTTGNIFEVSGNTKLGGQLTVTSSTTLQNFTALNSTSTNATSTNSFATTASSTNLFAQTAILGALTTPSLTLSGITGSTQCLHVNSSGTISGTGSDCGSGGSSYPFSLTGNATSTLTQFNGGLTAFASSTIGNGTQAGGLTVNGGATTTGSAYFAGNVGIGTQSPTKNLQVVGTADITDNVASLSVSQSGGSILSYNGAELFLGNSSFINLTGATAASTLPYASSTALTATRLYATNFLATGSSTLQNFTALQSTSTDATSTNSFATTASSTNLFATTATFGSLSGAGLSTCNSSTQKLLWSGGTFSCGTDLNTGGGGGTDVNWTFFNGSGIQVGTTTNQVLIGAASTSTLSRLEVHNGAFIDNSTTTNATSTNSFATTASSTNLFAAAAQVGTLTINGLSGFLKATAGAVSTALINLTTDVTGILPIANGGTATSTGGNTNGVTYYDGSTLTNSKNLSFATSLTNGTTGLGIGTTSPYAALTVALTPTASSSNNLAFAISSSTAAFATSSLFSISNSGAITAASTLAISGAITSTASSANTFPYASSTALTATSLYATNFLATGSSTLQNFTALQSTSTNATTTNFFATTASSTNLFAAAAQVGSLTINGLSGFLKATAGAVSTALINLTTDVTGILPIANGGTATSTGGNTNGVTYFDGSTLTNSKNLSFTTSLTNGTTGLGIGTTSPYAALTVALTPTASSSNNLAFAISSSTAAFATTTLFSVNNAGLATLTNLLATGSSTLQNFTALQSTSTNATSTNSFATTASSTNLFATGATLGATSISNGLTLSGNLTLGSITGSTQCLHVNSSGVVSGTATDCGAAGGNTSNWTYFNGSGIQLATTSNQVLIGASATTTLGKLEIAGGNIEHYASGNPTLASSSPSSDLTYQTVVVGHLAYMAENAGGLRILDVSNPRSPTTTGSYTGINTALSVAVAGKYAYVGDTTTGLNVIDVSNPAAPVRVGNYSFPTLPGTVVANGIAVSGKYVYMTDYNNAAIRIVDVSNPASPQWVGTFAIASGAPYGITVQGKYAYVADQGATGKIYVLDISNPVAPATAGTYTSSGIVPSGVYVSGKYLYVADSVKGFYMLDVSNPTVPTLAGSYKPDVSDAYFGVTAAGNYAYVADHQHLKTLVIDVSNPASPSLVGSYTVTNGAPMAVSLSGKYAYVSDYDGGLKIVDINGVNTPAASIGSLAATQATIGDSLSVGGDISAGGGLDVGISGIFSRGTISAFIASTTQINPVVANFIGGNVGLGTTTPWARLTIAAAAADANINPTLFAIASSTAAFATSTLFSIDNAGLITGLKFSLTDGTTTNSFSTTASSTNLFATTGNLSALTVNSNATIGGAASATGGYNTSGVTGGYKIDNNLVLQASTTRNSLAVGVNALNASNTGSANTAIGTAALLHLTTGISNTAVGNNALTALTTGQQNTANGDSALVSNITGSNNVASGYSALFFNTSATSSVAIGSAAGAGSAAYSNQGGVYVGYQAGLSLATNSDYNTLIGFNAGNNITTGANNIVIGAASTGANSNITTGSNNIQIGYNVKLPSATNNNQLDIGNIIYGTNVDGSASTLSTGAIGIGSTTPNARLAIHLNGGDTNLNAFSIGSSTAAFATSTLFVVNNSGNVGIGTTSPQSLLALSANNGSVYPNNNLFTIASSTSLGTQTLLSFDNSGRLTIGQNAAAVSNSTQLTVLAGTTTAQQVSQSTLGANGIGISVQGRYAYVVTTVTAHTFEIWDVSNPASPVRVSQSTLNANGAGISVQGRYAYIVDQTAANGFEVWDVSNPAAPVRISQSTLTHNGASIYVQGRYAYIADSSTTNSFEIWDVSNPASPVQVSQSTLGSNGLAVFVQGRYAYVTGGVTGHFFEIWDVGNPAAPVRVSQSTLGAGGTSLYVQGRYAYVGDNTTTNGFEVWDVSNPAAPSRSSQSTISGGALGMYVQGRYVYLIENGRFFETWDVSSPSAPVRVSTYNTLNANGVAIFVQGRYAYLIDGVAANGFEVWDLGGAYVQQLETGGIETGTLSVRNNLSAVDGSFSGGLTAGGALNVTGRGNFLSYNLATTSGATSASSTALSATAIDTNAAGVSDVFSLTHFATSTSAAGIGTGILFNDTTLCSLTNCNSATTTATSTARIASIFTNVSTTSPTADLAFFTKADSTGLSEVARFTSGGALGIGTTSPWANLSINAAAGHNSFAIGSSTSSYFVVNAVGNVGIGTSSPFTKLALTNGVTSGQVDIAYDNADYTILSTNATGQYIIVPSGNTAIVPNANLWVCTGGTVSSNACPSGTISGQGNIVVQNKLEIGTTTSSSKFDIETQDSTTNFVHIASSTNQNIFRIIANGNVGIGTSTPFTRLAVGAGGAITTVENSLTDAATITVDWTAGNQQKVTLGGNRTINFTNYLAGQILRLIVCQDATGSRTVTWDGAVLWQGAAAPTLTTTANYCDLVAFVASNATSTLKIFGSAALNFP